MPGYRFGKAFIDITANSSPLRKALRSVGTTLRSWGAKAVRTAKWAGLGIAAGLAYSLHAAMKQEDAEMLLSAAVRATGQAAGYTANQLKDMAHELQKVSRHGDEALMPIMALLSTFLEIRGPQFKEALERIMDMSAVLGGDLRTNAIQLAKALNDPIRGITALRRVGVSFTEQQIEMSKAFVLNNEMAKAQQVILDELGVEMAGVERAMALTTKGTLARMKNALADIAETIGVQFLPAMRRWAENITQWATDHEHAIGVWAAKTVAFIDFMKDLFWSFITYLRGDWQGGLKFMWDAFIATARAAMKTVVAVAAAGGRAAFEAFKESILGRGISEKEIRKRMMKLRDEEAAGKVRMPLFRGPFGAGLTEMGQHFHKMARLQLEEEKHQKLMGKTLEEITAVWEEAYQAIKAAAPTKLWAEWKTDLDEFMEKLKNAGKDLERPPALPPFVPLRGMLEERDKKVARAQFVGLTDMWSRLAESAFGKNVQQQQLTVQKESLKSLQTLVKDGVLMSDMIGDIYTEMRKMEHKAVVT